MNTPSLLIEDFLNAYIEAALFCSMADDEQPMDKKYSAKDLAPETLAKFKADCEAFYTVHNFDQLETKEQIRAAHDFFLTRTHQGSGFWDGDWPEPMATELTEASHKYGNVELYVGDDGKIYAM